MSEPVNASPAPAHGHAILRLLDRPVEAATLDTDAALAAAPAESGFRKALRLLLFRLGDETAALHVKSLRRVTPVARAIPIPHRTSGVLRGVCNIRGELVLCADLRRLLGLPEREPAIAAADPSLDPRRMVVVGPAENSWAFEVDALMGVESVDPAAFRDPPMTVAHALADFTLGVTEVNGSCVTVLESDRVLAGFKAGLA